jgi:hypothetical protein
MWWKLFAAFLPVACLAVAVNCATAHADCASGAGYRGNLTANTVTVCPFATARTCGSAIPFLRQNVADGSVVVVGGGTCAMGCYVDTCVAPGTYLYGWATAYDCSEAGCGSVSLFERVTVTSALPPTCTTAGNTTPTTATPPWESGGADADIPQSKSCPGGGCTCAAAPSSDRFAVRILDGLAIVCGLCVMTLRAGRRRTPGHSRS